MSSEPTTLPFSEMKQNAILGHMLVNEQFFRIVYKRIKPEWFLSVRNGNIFKMFIDCYEQLQTFPTIAEFRAYRDFFKLDNKEREVYYAFIARCISETQQIRLNAIKPDLTEWLHTIIMMKGMTDAAGEYEKQNIKRCYQILNTTVKEVSNTSFDSGNAVDFADFRSYLSESEEERGHALTTGLSILDKSILKDAQDGGLLYGDSTIFMAPTNKGKTTCLITAIGANVKSGKDVFYMTHEDRPNDIRLKLISNMLHCPISKIFELNKSKEGQLLIGGVTSLLNKHVKYIPYNKAGMTIEEVLPIIRLNQENWMSDHGGKGFDLFVNDYPAALGTELARKGNLQKRNIDEYVYDTIFQLGFEYKFHVLTAIQTNREGAKINKGLDRENRILQGEDVNESYGPIQKASNIITINRSPIAERMGLITYGISKSRSNKTGVAVIAKADFEKSTTHSNSMGGMSYHGTKCIEEFWEKWSQEYKNQEIPLAITSQLGI